jgi:hypothetical protein
MWMGLRCTYGTGLTRLMVITGLTGLEWVQFQYRVQYRVQYRFCDLRFHARVLVIGVVEKSAAQYKLQTIQKYYTYINGNFNSYYI